MGNVETYLGEWWLSKNPDIKFTGTLQIKENESYVLETIGGFQSDESESMILGVAKRENEVCEYVFKLVNCLLTKETPFNHLKSKKFKIGLILKSKDGIIDDSLFFDKISLRPSGIDKWCRSIAYHLKPTEEGFDLNYNKSEDFLLFKDENLEIKIEHSYQYGFVNSPPSEFNTSQMASINIYYYKGRELSKTLIDLKKIRDFFTLAFDAPAFYNSIELKQKNVSSTYTTPKYVNHKLYKKDFYKDVRYKEPSSTQFIFNLSDIKDNPEIFYNWMRLNEELKFILNNLFGTIYNGYLFLENSLLDHVFALEVYHRINFGNTELKGEEFLKLRSQIIEKLKEDNRLKEWFESKVKAEKKDITLKERLIYLIDRQQSLIGEVFQIESLFIDKVVETRHYLVHQNVREESLIIKNEFELFDTIEKLAVIIKSIVLKELGFDDSQIVSILKSSGEGNVIIN